jgi:hypothetical protein
MKPPVKRLRKSIPETTTERRKALLVGNSSPAPHSASIALVLRRIYFLILVPGDHSAARGPLDLHNILSYTERFRASESICGMVGGPVV